MSSDPTRDLPFDDPAAWLRARQWDQRVVPLVGELTDEVATRVATELMALDASGDDAVVLQMDATGGSLDAAFMLMDTVDLLGVPVHARVVGRLAGVGTGVLAVAGHRTASPHARFLLSLPGVEMRGSVTSLRAAADEHRRRADAFTRRLAEATGRALEQVEADVERGRWLDAEEAVAYGLVDTIETRPAPGSSDRPRLGFR